MKTAILMLGMLFAIDLTALAADPNLEKRSETYQRSGTFTAVEKGKIADLVEPFRSDDCCRWSRG